MYGAMDGDIQSPPIQMTMSGEAGYLPARFDHFSYQLLPSECLVSGQRLSLEVSRDRGELSFLEFGGGIKIWPRDQVKFVKMKETL
jgi:hypothetical protein